MFDWLVAKMGLYGVIAVTFILLLALIMLLYKQIADLFVITKFHKSKQTKKEQPEEGRAGEIDNNDCEDERQEENIEQILANILNRTSQHINHKEDTTNPPATSDEYFHYKFPTLDLLTDIQVKHENISIEEQEANKQLITETLNNYGIRIKHITVQVGPTVTLFEIIPEDGVRISKIRNLGDDIALSLAALGIRIIAPMPGRGTIGIEVPNREPQVVPIRSVLASKVFQETKYKLPMVLGCTVANEVYVADLTKMPHLLVAGATGQGKSVGLHCIITSLLYKKGPSELKFVLIDPKKVEFSLYSDIEKYFLAKASNVGKAIITDAEIAKQTLKSLIQEMRNRYQLLERAKTRKIEEYNNKWKNGLRLEVDEDGKHYEFMPYIVVIIDEFSDLILIGGKEIETQIFELAKSARAVGIHLIIATQRPQVKVVTGLIKANIPGRVAFKVAQMQDSLIILDHPGAEKLIGRGDMLFQANGELTRLQCPWIDTQEVERICNFIGKQGATDRNVEHKKTFILPNCAAEHADFGDRDPLFAEVAQWVVQSDLASTSAIQCRYQIGYNRAGRLMDQMEEAGIVGEPQGSKPRKVKVDSMTLDAMLGIKNRMR